MLVPLNWLKEFVNINQSAERIAEKLLLSGTKVESIQRQEGEAVFELEVTPNRPDTLSILGVAREVSALFEKDLIPPEINLLSPIKFPTNKVSIKIKDKQLCPNYSLVKLGGFKVQESDEWIQKYLKLSGIRPINNIVDITNLVMLELGQPMHAFDNRKIQGELLLRGSEQGETVVTLDGIERKLNEGAIIIEDEEKLVDLAGLMGGRNSEIDEKTEEVLLMVPVYDSLAIRKASIHTGLRTEASSRFEKKLDPNLHSFAANRAVKLFVEETGARLESSIFSFGAAATERFLNIELDSVKNVLGLNLTREDIFDFLTPLGFRVSMSPLREGELTIQIPSHRGDILLSEDIIEEIARMYGYNNFPKTLPQDSVPIQNEIFKKKHEDVLEDFLLNSGYSQLTGYSLVSESDLKNLSFPINKALKVLHPTSSEFTHLRPSLLINLIKAFATNRDYDQNSFFEIAKEFSADIDKKTNLPSQRQAVVFGNNFSLGKLKGELETLFLMFYESFNQISLVSDEIWEFGVTFETKEGVVAKAGKLQRALTSRFEEEKQIFAAWIDFEKLKDSPTKQFYKPLPKFPGIFEDISFYLAENFPINKVINELSRLDKLIYSVELKDVFLRNEKRSFTLGLEFRDETKTLVTKDIEKVRSNIEKTLQKKFQAKLRKE